MENNQSGRGLMMRFCLLFLFFLSYPLFAQNSSSVVTSSQRKGGQVQLNELTATVLLKQLQEKSVLLSDSIIQPSLFVSGIMKASTGSWGWVEPFNPSLIFNRCSNVELSIKCFWSLLRLDRLVGKGGSQNTQAISKDISVKNFKEEIRRIRTLDRVAMEIVAWFFLFSIEFYDWAVEKKVSQPDRLFPLTDDLAEELLSNNFVISTLGFADTPFLLYALHQYFLKRGFEEKKVQVEEYIRKIYLHRNDGSEVDLQGRTLMCEPSKRAGIHKDYLVENGLLFPDYKDFEERTASEDVKRIQKCEKDHSDMITEFQQHPGTIGHEVGIRHYSGILFVLYKVFGKDAVRHFFRHNPISRVEILPYFRNVDWFRFYHFRMRAFVILRDVYENDIDVEWQVEWQSAIEAHKEILRQNLLTLYSEEVLVSYGYVLHFTYLSLLTQE